jgi:hypothetical protein
MLGISEGDFSSGLVTACELRPPAATYHHERASELRVPAPSRESIRIESTSPSNGQNSNYSFYWMFITFAPC